MDRQNDDLKKPIQRLISVYEAKDLTKDFSSFEVDEFVSIINYYLNKENYKCAIKSANNAVSQYPYNSILLFKQAELLYHEQEYDNAIDILEKADLLSPNERKIHLLLGNIYDEIDEVDAAIEHLDIALSLGNDNNDYIYVQKAQIYLERDKFVEAIPNLKNALKINLNNTIALLDLVHCCNKLDKPFESVEFYEKIIDKDPYSYEAWNNLGLAYDIMGFHEKAIEAFELSTAINCDSHDSYYYKGNSYMEMEEYSKAKEAFCECLKYGKKDYHIYIQLGLSHIFLEEEPEARECFKKSIELKSDFSESWFWLGISYENEGKTSKAIPHLKRAVKLDPTNDKYWHELGNCHANTNNISNAYKAYEEALEINPYLTDAWIDFSMFLHDIKKSNESIDVLNEAISLNFESTELIYILAGILFDCGNCSKASYYLEKALQSNPEMSEILFDNFPYLYSNNKVIGLIKKYET